MSLLVEVLNEIFQILSFVFASFIFSYFTCSVIVVAALTVFVLNFGELSDEKYRGIALITFFTVLFLSLIFTAGEAIRRKFTVDRPVREIQQMLDRLAVGEYHARISENFLAGKHSGFSNIAKRINELAEELSGVETLRVDFISNVSHELKTPLAVMKNYGSLLQHPELSDEMRIEYAKSISDACNRLANLITNILKLNKLENQQIFPAMTEYDLSEQLVECLLQFENEWEKKNINIETDIPDEIKIYADAELLMLVWNNLLSNAFKFTEEDGTVGLSLSVDEKYATVKVSDTGCGIDPKVGSHIFDRFYQGNTSHSKQGNGLGLALVKRVVDIMQGEISIESALGKGSTFTVRIKRHQYE